MLAQWDQVSAYDTPTSVAADMPADALPETSPDFMTGLSDIVGAVTQWDLQRKAYDINLARAQQGLPAIDFSQYAPGVNVGMTTQTQQFATLALLGLGAVAIYAISKRRR
jgi:hypothetical protein